MKVIRYLLITVCMLQTGFVTLAQTCPPADTTQVVPVQDNWEFPPQNSWNGLEIMTWNVKSFPLSGYTTNNISETVSDMLPDVICFQEIADLYEFETLADGLPAYEFITTDYEADGGFPGYDLGIAVKSDCLQVLDTETLFPFDDWEFAYRNPLKAELAWSCGDAAMEFVMINVHFKCCNDGFDRRLAASQILVDYIHSQINSGNETNIIVAGDFNDDIDEPEYANSLWPLVSDDSVYFTTTPIAGDYNQQSYPWYSTPSFLDHILISDNLFDENEVSTVQTLRLDDYTGSNVYQNHFSDHRPVLWKFSLTTVDMPQGLVITEIMNNPDAVSDTYGEWFEVVNMGTEAVIMNGLILRDDGEDYHTITSAIELILQPQDYFVMGRNGDPSLNGNVSFDYIYNNLNLSNTWDEIIISHPNGEVIDEVAYDNGETYPDPTGASMILLSNDLDNSIGSNWGVSQIAWWSGDFCSPGLPNSGVNLCEPTGDVNHDFTLNVSDIVIIVGYILGQTEFTDEQICQADMNQDDVINVMDLVIIIDNILA